MKYIDILIKQLEEVKKGMMKHKYKWDVFPETPKLIDKHISELKKIDKELSKIKILLSNCHKNAVKLKTENVCLLKKLEKRIKGIHAGEEKYIKDYK